MQQLPPCKAPVTSAKEINVSHPPSSLYCQETLSLPQSSPPAPNGDDGEFDFNTQLSLKMH